MDKPSFCLTCRKLVFPLLKEEEETHTFKGEKFLARFRYSRCPFCDQQFITGETQDYNLALLQKLYWERMSYNADFLNQFRYEECPCCESSLQMSKAYLDDADVITVKYSCCKCGWFEERKATI